MKNLFSYIKMGKEILTFGNIEIEKKLSPIFLGDVDIEKYYYLKRFLLVKKTISTLLVTCTMIIKLSHCI